LIKTESTFVLRDQGTRSPQINSVVLLLKYIHFGPVFLNGIMNGNCYLQTLEGQ